MTIKQALNLARQNLDSIDAKVLLKFILKKDNTYIIANANKEMSRDEENELQESIQKIKDGFPLQYITHNQEFMGINFEVNQNVLIPQPDTEILVENTIGLVLGNKSLENQENSKKTTQILDLCTGSGAIAISLKKYLPDVKIFASDISEKALEVARKNAKNNNVEIEFIKSDMFENIHEKFDIIVSNPPYIKSKEIEKLSKEVQNEPKLALDGGKDGLKFYKIISKEIKNYLKENGTLLMEIGYDEANEVMKLFENSTCIKDYANNDRVIVWNRG